MEIFRLESIRQAGLVASIAPTSSVPPGSVGLRPKMGFFRRFRPSKQPTPPLKTRVRAF
jgi:hypothetical protein